MTTKRKPLPPNIRVLWNKVRRSRTTHTLKCGCVIGPGIHYHSTGMLINGKHFAYAKQHLVGCLEVLH